MSREPCGYASQWGFKLKPPMKKGGFIQLWCPGRNRKSCIYNTQVHIYGIKTERLLKSTLQKEYSSILLKTIKNHHTLSLVSLIPLENRHFE